mgnify:CR=1 FL=1
MSEGTSYRAILNEVRLERVTELTVETDLQHDVQFQFTFPDLIKDGVPATSQIDLVYTGGVQSESDTIYLEDYDLGLDNGTPAFNKLRFEADIEVYGTGNQVLGTETLDFGFGITDSEFSLINGDFGNQDIFDFADTIPIALFENFLFGQVQFTNPSLKFGFRNSFGVPVQINFNEIKAIEDNTGNEKVLVGIPSDLQILAPAAPGGEELSELILDGDNTTNIQSIISPTPKRIIFDIGGELNPGGGANANFVTDESELSLNMEVTMPLEGFAKNFTMKDNLDLTVSLPEFVEYVEFKLGADNGFPLEAEANLVFMDENYDTLVVLTNPENSTLEGAPVNATTGRVSGIQTSNITFIVKGDDVERMRDTKYLLIHATTNTTDADQNQSVKLYDDYSLELRLGMRVKADVSGL